VHSCSGCEPWMRCLRASGELICEGWTTCRATRSSTGLISCWGSSVTIAGFVTGAAGGCARGGCDLHAFQYQLQTGSSNLSIMREINFSGNSKSLGRCCII